MAAVPFFLLMKPRGTRLNPLNVFHIEAVFSLNQLGLKKGQIPESGATGEGIEIHRIENELMAHTSGYTMLDHSHMAFLYDRIPMETPVAIVGARQEQNSIAHTFATHDDRKGESSPP